LVNEDKVYYSTYTQIEGGFHSDLGTLISFKLIIVTA